MGYEHRALRAACGHCGKQVAWSWKLPTKAPVSWRCECEYRNVLKPPPKWPDLPLTIYMGYEQHKRLKLHPLPPDAAEEKWVQPYSIRSFLYQASRALGGCYYTCRDRGMVMDERVFSDRCIPSEEAENMHAEDSECHIASGWTNGETSCPLWSRIAALCQTDSERRFLHKYLSFVKHRQFPMILPQTWVDIADRRRPDFVAYVPLQYWNYKWVAIQLDASHTEEQAASDSIRDAQIAEHNYDVVSLRPQNTGYLEEVRRLVERFDAMMTIAEDDVWSVAIDGEVARTEADIEPPF